MDFENKGPIYPEQPYNNGEEQEIITVDTGEDWKMTESPNIIETTALGPCVGVVIYDPENKRAMVGHFPDPENSDFKNMLKAARTMTKNPANLQVFLGGNEPMPSDTPYTNHHKMVAEYVAEELDKQGFGEEQITIRWQKPLQYTFMRIDTTTGEMEYEIEDDDDPDKIPEDEDF